MEKFVVHVGRKAKEYRSAMIDCESYDKLQQLKDETGVPVGRLLTQMVDFCIERIEIVE